MSVCVKNYGFAVFIGVRTFFPPFIFSVGKSEWVPSSTLRVGGRPYGWQEDPVAPHAELRGVLPPVEDLTHHSTTHHSPNPRTKDDQAVIWQTVRRQRLSLNLSQCVAGRNGQNIGQILPFWLCLQSMETMPHTKSTPPVRTRCFDENSSRIEKSRCTRVSWCKCERIAI